MRFRTNLPDRPSILKAQWKKKTVGNVNQINWWEICTTLKMSTLLSMVTRDKLRHLYSSMDSQFEKILTFSQLDYCNSLLASLPANGIQPLKLTQNAVGASRLQPSKVFTPRPWYGHSTDYQLLLGSDSKFWLWPTLQPTRRPLPTYRTLFRPTHQLDHSALLPQADLLILPDM